MPRRAPASSSRRLAGHRGDRVGPDISPMNGYPGTVNDATKACPPDQSQLRPVEPPERNGDTDQTLAPLTSPVPGIQTSLPRPQSPTRRLGWSCSAVAHRSRRTHPLAEAGQQTIPVRRSTLASSHLRRASPDEYAKRNEKALWNITPMIP